MSAGGLLASMIGGAAQSGMNSANKIATEKREHKRNKGLLEDSRKREDQVIEEERKWKEEQDKIQFDRQTARDTINYNRDLTLANTKKRTAGSGKSDWVFKEVTNETGGKVAGRYNAKTNVFEPLGVNDGSQNGGANNSEILENLANKGLYNQESSEPKITSLKELEQNEQASKIAANATINSPTDNPGWKNTAEAKMVEEGAKIILQGGTPQRAQLGIMLRYDLPPEIKEKVEKLFYAK